MGLFLLMQLTSALGKIFSRPVTQIGSFGGIPRQVDGSIEEFVFLYCPNKTGLFGLIRGFFLSLKALFHGILHPSSCLMEA
jgi:hypothetical protein